MLRLMCCYKEGIIGIIGMDTKLRLKETEKSS
jgi:hypothetical protein